MTTTIEALYDSLLDRQTPETVAGLIRDLPEVMADAAVADRVVKIATARPHWSSMPDSFFAPVALDTQVATALELFAVQLAPFAGDPRIVAPTERSVRRLTAFVDLLSQTIGRRPGAQTHSRLDREARAGAGIDLSSKAYLKRFRFLVRFEEHLAVHGKETRLGEYRLAGKAGLVSLMDRGHFVACPWAAAFIAYYTARKKRRSEFTNTAQSRPFDELCELLLARVLARSPDDALFAVALVFPEPRILERLDEARKGRLLGAWGALMGAIARDLGTIAETTQVNVETMIVRPGNDSSTWNLTALAWNNARTAWFSLLAATGQQGLLDLVCPGKVMRLMAADVAVWHRHSGGQIHPDTAVFARLPKPWEVFSGKARCTRADVVAACGAVGLDPARSGWIEGQVSTHAEAFRPTPELVHGVSIASPELAAMLRQAGAFGGPSKGARRTPS